MFFRKRRRELTGTRIIKTYGLNEADIKDNLKGLELDTNILKHPKGVDIRINVEGERGEMPRNLLDAAEARIRDRLGACVFGVDNDRMEEVVGRKLLESEMTLAVAESCTGGLICHWITNIEGSSKYFIQGFIAYANSAKQGTLKVSPSTLKQFGGVSAETVEEMAKNAQELSGSSCALAVSGIAGPGGGSEEKPVGTAYICVLAGKKIETKKYFFEGWRELIKIQAAQAALDLIRRELNSR